MTIDEWKEHTKKHYHIYYGKGTNKAAKWALGSSIELMENIMANKIKNGFAIIRPPGHHALSHSPFGYCYLNNIAVCAKMALEKYKLNRILIFDWLV